MALWSRFRSLHLGWQIAIGAALIAFWPLLLIALPVAAYSALKQKPRAYRLAAVVAALVPIGIFAAVMGAKNFDSDEIRRQMDEMDGQQHGMELLVQKSAPSGGTQAPASTASVEPTKTETAYDRIVSIVGKYGEYPVISNLSDLNAKNPKPPYEVIVAMTAKSCFSAKEKALNIIRDLYQDAATAPILVRVKVIDPEYLSASLGADDGRTVSAEAWKANGPSLFIQALQGGATYDMDTVREATNATASSYTYAELERGCQ